MTNINLLPISLLVLVIAASVASTNPSSSSTRKASFTIHYPKAMLCSNCILNFATSLNWTGYTPESNFRTTFNLSWVSGTDKFVSSSSFPSNLAGTTHTATVYYNAWSSTADDRIWLNGRCRNVLNNKSGNNKGRTITFTLPKQGDANFDFYPSFCYNEGQVRSFKTTSPAALGSLVKTIYYYVPASLIENPIPRPVNYLLQGDAHAIQDSLKTTYDFLTSQGLIPETIVFGSGQGSESDPWADGASTQRTFEMTPFPCQEYPGTELPPCSALPRVGGAFKSLDWLLGNDVFARIRANLSLPAVGREYMATSGYSYGGLDACIYAYMNSSIFSKGYCGSGSMWFNNNQFARIVKAGPPAKEIKLFLDVGARENPLIRGYVPGAYEALLDRTREFKLGVNLMFADYSSSSSTDSHQWNSWNTHTALALSFLYNEGSITGASLTPLGVVKSYGDGTRPFALGSTFVIPSLPFDQENGAAPSD